jgi:hypothetical protein
LLKFAGLHDHKLNIVLSCEGLNDGAQTNAAGRDLDLGVDISLPSK